MSETRSSQQLAWAQGLSVFAGTMLVTVGAMGILQGISALANDKLFVQGIKFTYALDLTQWGWIHLILGIVLALVGVFIFTRQAWARWTGIFIAALAILANFMWLPYYPLWSVVMIVLCIASIWALAVYQD